MKELDFVEIEFIGRIVGTEEVFDLTSEKDAKEMGIHNPEQKYGPSLVIVGSNMAVPGVEKKLLEMKVGEEKEFVLEPKDAFGPRNPKIIKIFSYSSFISQKINPVPGAFVTINGRQAKIQSVSGGRVRVDFNHPLAGKQLRYNLKIVRSIDGVLEKAKSLLEYYRIELPVELDGEILTVRPKKDPPEQVKKMISELVLKWIKEIKKVSFVPDEEKKPSSSDKNESAKKPAAEKPETVPKERASEKSQTER